MLMNGEPSGREDWDYVSMENYSKDTKELTDQATHIIDMQAKQIRELKKLLGLMVYCAGIIEIPNHLIMTDSTFTVTREPCYSKDSTVFRSAV